MIVGRRQTFGRRRGHGLNCWRLLCVVITSAFGMQLLGLSQLTTLGALRNRTSLLLDLEKRTIRMVARGRSMTFDAGFTVQTPSVMNRTRRTASTMQTSCY